MTDEQKAELHDLLDTLIYAQLSVQPRKREKALRNVEGFVDRIVAERDAFRDVVIRDTMNTHPVVIIQAASKGS